MRLLFRVGLFVLLLALSFVEGLFPPRMALAMQTTTWDFSNETFPEGWEVSGSPSLKITREGLLLKTSTETMFGRAIALRHPIEIVAIDYRADKRIEGWLTWHEPGKPAEDFARSPLLFSPTEGIGTVSVNMTKYENWDGEADFMGLGLPAGGELLIQRIRVQSWNPVEKLVEGIQSFWTFDVRRPSSVNFLWGPHLAWNPIARNLMFRVTPPRAVSANVFFYLILGVACLWAFLRLRRHPMERRRIWGILLTITAGLWIFYDLRMGSEFFGYLKRDYRTYWSRPIGERTFRERSYFNDFALSVASLVEDEERYIFVAPYRWPYLGLMRYATYPSVPVDPPQENTVRTWIVYNRPDIRMNGRGELMSEGIVLSPSGEVVHEFEEGSFVFRTRP